MEKTVQNLSPWRGPAVALAFLVLASAAQADLTLYQNDFDLYGKAPNTSAGICAAVSAVNGLVYLQNRYPSVYGTSLVPDWNANGVVDLADEITSRDMMTKGWTHGGLTREGIYPEGGGGGTAEDIWTMTYYWLLDFAPSTTLQSGKIRTTQSTSSWPDSQDLVRSYSAYPDWAYLWDSLAQSKMIHLGITPLAGGMGHAVVLYGLGFDDLDADGLWDVGETPLKIGFVDPNQNTAGLTEPIWADVTVGPNNRLEFEWWYNQSDFFLYRVFCYEPDPALVPEPGSLVLLAGLALVLAVRGICRRAK